VFRSYVALFCLRLQGQPIRPALSLASPWAPAGIIRVDAGSRAGAPAALPRSFRLAPASI